MKEPHATTEMSQSKIFKELKKAMINYSDQFTKEEIEDMADEIYNDVKALAKLRNTGKKTVDEFIALRGY